MKHYIRHGVVYFDKSEPTQLIDVIKILTSNDEKLVPWLYSFKINNDRFNIIEFQKFLSSVRTLVVKIKSFHCTFDVTLSDTATSTNDFCKKFGLLLNYAKSGTLSDDDDSSPEVDDSFESFEENENNKRPERERYKRHVGERSL